MLSLTKTTLGRYNTFQRKMDYKSQSKEKVYFGNCINNLNVCIPVLHRIWVYFHTNKTEYVNGKSMESYRNLTSILDAIHIRIS